MDVLDSLPNGEAGPVDVFPSVDVCLVMELGPVDVLDDFVCVDDLLVCVIGPVEVLDSMNVFRTGVVGREEILYVFVSVFVAGPVDVFPSVDVCLVMELGPVEVLDVLVCVKVLPLDDIGPVDVFASVDVCLLNKFGPVEVFEVLVCVLLNGEVGPGDVGVTGPVEVLETLEVVVTFVLPDVGFTGFAKYVLLLLPKVGLDDPTLFFLVAEDVFLFSEP